MKGINSLFNKPALAARVKGHYTASVIEHRSLPGKWEGRGDRRASGERKEGEKKGNKERESIQDLID
jgi:hypothetical protein